jgi:hypothetical protein
MSASWPSKRPSLVPNDFQWGGFAWRYAAGGWR